MPPEPFNQLRRKRMLKIRLSMIGAKKTNLEIVIADSRFPRDGRFIEKVGLFNPLLPKEKKERITIEARG